MVSLVNDQKADRVKGPLVKLSHAHGLDHGDDEILFHIKNVTLDAADGGPWTKLLDLLDPLVREEFLVDDDHGPDLQVCRKSQGDCSFPVAAREGQDTASFGFKSFDSSRKCFVLTRRVS